MNWLAIEKDLAYQERMAQKNKTNQYKIK